MMLRIIVMFAITLVSLIDDFRRFKISNKIVCISAFTACGLIFLDMANLINYVSGGIVTFFILFILYILGAVGGGDVKLLSVIGIIVGIRNVWMIVAASFVSGAVIGLAGIVFGKCRKQAKGHVIHFTLAILAGEIIWLGGII